ncbi:hypothetical protein M569_09954 [Genlisea aurea]|uniref:Uncharacterized protein n=1 Tax=Genlisea aurea TaxID=192259 RepID=S8CD45_9LAMI|nr:hypothetical protein M569_09954 [Genlisea aurea]
MLYDEDHRQPTRDHHNSGCWGDCEFQTGIEESHEFRLGQGIREVTKNTSG